MGCNGLCGFINKTARQIRDKANKLGLTLNKAAAHRIVHDKAKEYMLNHNPMKQPETVSKVKKWRKENPETVKRINRALIEACGKIQKSQPSKPERKLREMLRSLGVQFEPAAIIKPKFIVDIRIKKLILEMDGDYWHGHPRFTKPTDRQIAQQKRDRARDKYLQACGYTVVRIWESDLKMDHLISILLEHGVIGTQSSTCNSIGIQPTLWEES